MQWVGLAGLLLFNCLVGALPTLDRALNATGHRRRVHPNRRARAYRGCPYKRGHPMADLCVVHGSVTKQSVEGNLGVCGSGMDRLDRWKRDEERSRVMNLFNLTGFSFQ